MWTRRCSGVYSIKNRTVTKNDRTATDRVRIMRGAAIFLLFRPGSGFCGAAVKIVADIDDLTHIEGRDRVAEAGAGSFERLPHHGAQLVRRVGAVNRAVEVVRVH